MVRQYCGKDHVLWPQDNGEITLVLAQSFLPAANLHSAGRCYTGSWEGKKRINSGLVVSSVAYSNNWCDGHTRWLRRCTSVVWVTSNCLSRIFNDLLMCMNISPTCMNVFHTCEWRLRGSENSVRFPRTKVKDGCEPLCNAGNRTQVHHKRKGALLLHWANSSSSDLVEGSLHRRKLITATVNLTKTQGLGEHRPRSELTTICLLNGHSIQLLSKSISLYPWIDVVLRPPQENYSAR